MKVNCACGCGEQLEKTVPWKKYASPACKQKAWALREAKKDRKRNKK